MSEHTPEEGKVVGIVLSSNEDDSPDLFTVSKSFDETSNWTNIVERIRDGDPAASEELYPQVLRLLEYSCRSRLVPDEADDRVQETYLAVLQAIQNGDLREPEKLIGFIRIIGHRQYCAYVRRRDKSHSSQPGREVFEESSRSRFDPEHDILEKERRSFAQGVLAQLAPREREILERFYVQEETRDRICEKMDLTSTQFRLLKWRAKAKVTIAAGKGRRLNALRTTMSSTGDPSPVTSQNRVGAGRTP
jgi:RNA polymerase sigma-70 factor, ECF subfamily